MITCVTCARVCLRRELRQVRVRELIAVALLDEHGAVQALRDRDELVSCLACYCHVTEDGSGTEKARAAVERRRVVELVQRADRAASVAAAVRALPEPNGEEW